MTAKNTVFDTREESDFDPQKYQLRYAVDAEKTPQWAASGLSTRRVVSS